VGKAQLCEKAACHDLTHREVRILEYGLYNVSKHKRPEKSEQKLYAMRSTRVDPQQKSSLPRG
ncbi:hypothetical protein IWW34DRAFT_634379, partial [Fusarium oxysporum f. sp. albedinis]